MKLLTHLFDGLLLIGDSYTDSRIYKADRHGFAADSKNLARDVRVVGADIRGALKKAEHYGQTYPGQSSKSKRKQSTAHAA